MNWSIIYTLSVQYISYIQQHSIYNFEFKKIFLALIVNRFSIGLFEASQNGPSDAGQQQSCDNYRIGFFFLSFLNLWNCYLNQINRNVRHLGHLKGIKLVHPTQNVSGEEALYPMERWQRRENSVDVDVLESLEMALMIGHHPLV